MNEGTAAPLRVAALVYGERVPSARFRVLQHAARLDAHGVELRPFIPVVPGYPPAARALRPLWALAALAERVPMTLATRHFDLTLLQRTMIPHYATLERFTKAPRVLDVDDAVHLRRGGRGLAAVARRCALVICGNDFLAEWYADKTRVAVLPTAVDTQRWSPAPASEDSRVVGWMGSSGDFRYLAPLQDALRAFLEACPGWTLRIVSDARPSFPSLPADRWSFAPWSSGIEASETARFSIGIMPLPDGPYERGKCSYKMLLYMSCGVPVVVSPVGMNADVLRRGACGAGATRPEEWTSALVELARDEGLRRRMGAEGRRIVEAEFSSAVVAPKLAALLLGAAGRA